MSRAREMLDALRSAGAGGRLGQPQGVEIAGVSGAPTPRMWDAVVSARAPELTGDAVVFVALPDGTLVVEEDVPDGSLGPLADELERSLAPPYRAAAARLEGDVWSAVAQSVDIVEVPALDGDVVDLSVVGGVRDLRVDGRPTSRELPALDALTGAHEDAVLHAERVERDLFAVEVFPL